jgi:hypothetical protein
LGITTKPEPGYIPPFEDGATLIYGLKTFQHIRPLDPNLEKLLGLLSLTRVGSVPGIVIVFHPSTVGPKFKYLVSSRPSNKILAFLITVPVDLAPMIYCYLASTSIMLLETVPIFSPLRPFAYIYSCLETLKLVIFPLI